MKKRGQINPVSSLSISDNLLKVILLSIVIWILVFLYLLKDRFFYNSPLNLMNIIYMASLYALPLIIIIIFSEAYVIKYPKNKFIFLFSPIISLVLGLIPYFVRMADTSLPGWCGSFFWNSCIDNINLFGNLFLFYIIFSSILTFLIYKRKWIYIILFTIVLLIISSYFYYSNCGIYGCYYKALNEGNPSYCNKLGYIYRPLYTVPSNSYPKQNYECILDLANKQKDVTICSYSPPIRLFDCFSDFNYSMECEGINRIDIKDYCYFFKATGCPVNTSMVNPCVTVWKIDSSVCDNIVDEQIKSECFDRYKIRIRWM